MRDGPRTGVVVVASVRRAVLENTLEVAPLIMTGASLAVALMSQAFLARLVDASPNRALGDYQGQYAAYLLVGVAVLDLQHATIGGLARAIRDAQTRGSLEALLASPTPTPVVLLALAVPSLLAALGRMLLYVGAGHLLFGVSPSRMNLAGVIVMLAAALLSFFTFNVLGAAITMFFRRLDPTSRLVAALSAVAGGVFYPTSILPPVLARLGSLLPIKPALVGMRAAMLHGAGPNEVRGSLLHLFTILAVVGPIAALAFARMLTRARRDGSLTAW